MGCLPVFADENDLLPEQFPLSPHRSVRPDSPVGPPWSNEILPFLPYRATAADRWEKFQTDFGIQRKETSFWGGPLQSAKYQLDEATFGIQEFGKSIEQTLRFNYGFNDLTGAKRPVTLRRPYSIWESLERTRFRSEFNLQAGSQGFIGVKLELPIGD
jgi:hypothetical protein